jgi:hypothetical protein
MIGKSAVRTEKFLTRRGFTLHHLALPASWLVKPFKH